MDDNIRQGRINHARLVAQARERAKLSRETLELARYSPREHAPGEKSYVSPEEAIRALGLLRNHERLATSLVYRMIGGKPAHEAAREAADAGISRHAVREMISRTQRIIEETRHLGRPVLSPRNNGYAKGCRPLDLVKAEKAPAGFVDFGSKVGGKRRPSGSGGYDYWYPGQGVTGKPHDDEHHDHHDAHRKHLERQLSEAREKSKPSPEVHAKFMEIAQRAADNGIRIAGKHPNGSHTLEHMERVERRLNRAIAKKNAAAAARGETEDAVPPTGEPPAQSGGEDDNRRSGENVGDIYDGLSPREQVREIRQNAAAFGDFIADMKKLGLKTESLEAAHGRLSSVLKRIGADSDMPVIKPSERETLKQLAGALRWMTIGMLTGFLAGGGHAGIAGLAAGSRTALIDQKGIKQAHKQALQRFGDHKEMHAASRELLAEFEKKNAAEKVETDEDAPADVQAPPIAQPEARPHFGDQGSESAKEGPNRAERRAAARAERRKPKQGKDPEKKRAARKKRREQQKASRRKNRTKKSLYIDMRTGQPLFASPADLIKASVDKIHALCDRAGIEWDDNPEFMNICEKLVGKRHLDDMDDRELQIVADAISKAEDPAVSRKIKLLMEEGYPQKQAVAIALDMQRRGKLSKAGPFIGPRGGKWADARHTIPWKETGHAKHPVASHDLSSVYKQHGPPSPLTDEDGGPLTVYQANHATRIHGADAGSEAGIYLTPRRRYAQRYGPNLHRAYIAFSNPLVVESKGEISPKDLTHGDIRKLISQGYDGIVVRSPGVSNAKASEVVAFSKQSLMADIDAYRDVKDAREDYEYEHGLRKAGPYIGPRGGKWADPEHTIPYKPTAKRRGKKKVEEPTAKRRGKKKVPTKRRPPASQLPAEVQTRLKDLGVGKLPQADIPVEHIHVRLDGDPHETAVIKWRDTKGRLQSGYTPEFHKRNAAKKWARVMRFIDGFKATKRNLHKALRKAEPGSREHQAALVAAIVAHTGLRPGSAASAAHGHYGVSTLVPTHVSIDGNKVSFEYVGKQGKTNTATIRNTEIAQALTPYMKGGNLRNKPMFGSTVVADARKLLPGGMLLKDMRTINATQEAMRVLDSVVTPPPLTGNSAKDKRLLAKSLLEASRTVADKLNNSPAVARSSYVHPEVFRKWAIDRAGADPKLFEEVS